jgi:hypothetical protein
MRFPDGVEPSFDREAGAWIPPGLLPVGEPLRVGHFVPTGFEGYVEIGHGPYTPDDDQGPLDGEMPRWQRELLLPMLLRHTTTPARCWFGQWEGFGQWSAGSGGFMVAGRGLRGRLAVRRFRREERRRQEAELRALAGIARVTTHFTHLLLEGPLEALVSMEDSDIRPSTITWPEDRAWFLSSDIDPPWSHLGGARALVDEVLATPALQPTEVRPEDRFVRNPVPPPPEG